MNTTYGKIAAPSLFLLLLAGAYPPFVEAAEAGGLVPTTGPFPYRRDVSKSDGWVEMSTPVLTLMRTKYPGEESGDVRVTSLAIAPNGDRILATRYGVLRSRDRGVTWTRLDGESKATRASANTGYPECSGSIQIDPEDSNRMAFLWFRGTSYFTDGTVWKNIGDPGFDYASIDWSSKIPEVIMGPRHGTWILNITRDGGKSWDAQDNRCTGTGELGSGASNGVVCVIDANTMVYNNVSDNKPSGLFRSTDAGRTWTRLRHGITECGKTGVALRDGRVYIAAARKLLISRDKGATWTERRAPHLNQGPHFCGDWSKGKVGGMLVKSHERVSYSRDEGRTWITLVGGDSANAFPPKHRAEDDGYLYTANATDWVYNADACDYRYGGGAWAFDPLNNIIYASTMGGPVVMKRLPGPGPGPGPAGDIASTSMAATASTVSVPDR